MTGGRLRAFRLAALVPLLAVGCERAAGPPEGPSIVSTESGGRIGPVPGPTISIATMSNPYGDMERAVAEGRRLFTWYNCSGCHGSHAGGGMGPSLRDSTWMYGGEDQDIYASIDEGRRHGMPAWGTRLPSDQIWKLVSYIRSLGTDEEASPPPAAPDIPPSLSEPGEPVPRKAKT